MKTCTCCLKEKDESCYSRKSKARSKLRSSCKECEADKFKQYYGSNIGVLREKSKTRMRRLYQSDVSLARQKATRYRLTIKDKIKEWNKKDYIKHREKRLASCRAYRITHRNEMLEWFRSYQKKQRQELHSSYINKRKLPHETIEQTKQRLQAIRSIKAFRMFAVAGLVH